MALLRRAVFAVIFLVFATTTAIAGSSPGGGESTTGICTIGVTGAGSDTARAVMYFDGTDNWLLAIKPSTSTCAAACTTLMTQGVIEAAHISLFFPVAPCTMTVRARLVENYGNELCPYPDRFTQNNSCPPFNTVLIADAQDQGQEKTFTIPFPITTPWNAPSCAIISGVETHFLELNFLSVSPFARDTLTRPRVVPTVTRTSCLTYNGEETNRFAADVTSAADLEMNNPKIWVDVLWCESTPTRRQTWGRLKQIYR